MKVPVAYDKNNYSVSHCSVHNSKYILTSSVHNSIHHNYTDLLWEYYKFNFIKKFEKLEEQKGHVCKLINITWRYLTSKLIYIVLTVYYHNSNFVISFSFICQLYLSFFIFIYAKHKNRISKDENLVKKCYLVARFLQIDQARKRDLESKNQMTNEKLLKFCQLFSDQQFMV